jgi:hypothetical protein
MSAALEARGMFPKHHHTPLSDGDREAADRDAVPACVAPLLSTAGRLTRTSAREKNPMRRFNASSGRSPFVEYSAQDHLRPGSVSETRAGRRFEWRIGGTLPEFG